MRTSSTFSILFWIYGTRAKNNQTSIYARVTVDGKRANISLKLKVNVRTWDSNKQRAKGSSKTSRTLNQYLDMSVTIGNHILNLTIRDNGIFQSSSGLNSC